MLFINMILLYVTSIKYKAICVSPTSHTHSNTHTHHLYSTLETTYIDGKIIISKKIAEVELYLRVKCHSEENYL